MKSCSFWMLVQETRPARISKGIEFVNYHGGDAFLSA
jgi:hypothetical protein